MVKSEASAAVVYDPSSSRAYGSHSRLRKSEWRNFMSSNLADMYRKPISGESSEQLDSDNEMDISKLLKDVEYMGSYNMTWKERKQLENRNVVALGGKPVKKCRTPLSVAKAAMKNQKKREQKKIEEERILGRFVKPADKRTRKREPEDRVLRSTEGHFKKGILDVKHLLSTKPSKRDDDGPARKMKGRRKKGKGKKKGRRKGR